MKGLAIALVCAACVLSAGSVSASKASDYLDSTYLCISLLPPFQIPIPWDSYDTENLTWGEQDVNGLALGLIYGENNSLSGLDFGIAVRSSEVMNGVQLGLVTISGDGSGFQCGLFNRAELFHGLQLGLVNWSDDLYGVQLGVCNIISKGPVPFFPLFNMWF